MNIKLKYLLFISFELLLLSVIIILAIKIYNLTKGKVKGINVIVLNKGNLTFDISKKYKYFYEPKPNTIQEYSPYWLGYKSKSIINDDGLNETKNYSIEKPLNTIRIVVLGDSFTYGLYVNTSDSYPKQLEYLLKNKSKCDKNFEVINLGVTGYDLAYSTERYALRGAKYNPDLVIWLLQNLNFYEIKEYSIPILERLIQQRVLAYDPVSNDSPLYSKMLSEMKILFSDNQILDYQKKALESINSYYKGRLVIISFNSLLTKYKQIISELIQKHSNVSYFDGITDINQKAKYHVPDGHPNIEGHEQIAKDIYNYLTSGYLSNCSVK